MCILPYCRWAGAELNPELRPQPDFFDADDLRSLFDQGPNGSSGGRNRNFRGSGGGGGYDRSGQRGVSNANSGYVNSRGTRGGRGSGGGGGRARAPNEVPSFPYLARCLGRADMLPAIVFIFSRNGCDRAAMEVARQQAVSLTQEESTELNQRLKAFEAATAGGLLTCKKRRTSSGAIIGSKTIVEKNAIFCFSLFSNNWPASFRLFSSCLLLFLLF